MKTELISQISGFTVACGFIAAGTPASVVLIPALTSAATLGGFAVFGRKKPYKKEVKGLANRLSKTFRPVAVMGPRGEAMDKMADAIKALKPDDCPTRDMLAEYWGEWDKLTDVAMKSMAAREPAFAGQYADDARKVIHMAFMRLCEDTDFATKIIPDILANQSRILNRIEEKIDFLVAEKQKEAEAKGAPLSAEQLTTFEDGIRAVLISTDSRKAPAQEMLAEQREIDAADYLMSAGLQGEAQLQDAMKDQASFFKEAGEIYQASMPAKALEAFRKATQLDGSDFNAWIYLARLEKSHAGDLAAARIAAKAGLDATSDEREKSVVYNTIGDIAVAEGNLAEARDAYTKSMEIAQALSDADQNSASAKRDLSVSLDRLGDIAVAEGNLAEARDAYTKSMEIRQALSDADQNSASARRNLSVSLEKLGDIAVAGGNLTDARDAYTKSMDIRQALSDADQNSAEAKRDLSVSLNKIGDIAVAEGNLTETRDAYTKSMEIAQALSDADQNSASAKRDLSVSLERLGDIAVAEGNLTEARDAYTKSMDILQALSDADQNSASAKRDLSVSLNKLGDIAVAEGNLTEARDAYTKSMEIRQALSDADQNSAEAKRDLSVSLNKIGDIAVAEGNLKEARDAYTKSMYIKQALSDADPNSASAKRDVIVSHHKLGMFYLKTEGYEKAANSFEAVVSEIEQMSICDPLNFGHKVDLLENRFWLAVSKRDKNLFAECGKQLAAIEASGKLSQSDREMIEIARNSFKTGHDT